MTTVPAVAPFATPTDVPSARQAWLHIPAVESGPAVWLKQMSFAQLEPVNA
jgi:hypothetical protein